MAGALPSDTVKNPTQNINSTSPALSARSYPRIDLQCLSYPSTSINAETCSKEVNPNQTLEDVHNPSQATKQPHDDKPDEDEQEEKNSPENINTNPSSPSDPSV
ncbi:hypothetical protein Tco_0523664 [Tanacetum coccineum]